MEVIKVKCAYCGQDVSIIKDNETNVCPHCGKIFETEQALLLEDCLGQSENKKSKDGKRVLKQVGSVILLVLECIWTLISTLFFINLFLDFTDKSDKK